MGVELNITNNTGADAYYLIWGFADGESVDKAPWSYLTPDGVNASKLVAFPNPPQKEGASHSIVSLIAKISGSAGNNSVTLKNIPNLISGNVFFSFQQRPTSFNTVPSWASKGVPAKAHNGFGVQPPDYHPNAPDANTIFCSSEFTLDSSGVWADTTDVDYFAAPITVEVNGSSGKQISGKLNSGVTRDDVFSAFQDIQEARLADFKKLVMTNGSKNVRILAPGHGIEAGLFPAGYFDKYVAHCLGLYTAPKSLVVTVEGTYAGVYHGTASGTTLNFDKDGGSLNLTAGNSKDIFLCDGQLAAPNNAAGAVAARIGAALNRTVLHVSGNQPVCSGFYSAADSNKSWWASNWYSKLLHDKMAKVYGFPFDDVCDNDSTKPLLHDPKPSSVSFILESWT